jgi:hypothetical protein
LAKEREHIRPGSEPKEDDAQFGVMFSRWCQKYDLYNDSYPTSDKAVPFQLFYVLAQGMVCADAKERLQLTRAIIVARLQTHADDRSAAVSAMQEEVDEANGIFRR